MVLVIYVKEGCPYCQKVKDYIEDNSVEDVEIYTAGEDFKVTTFKNKYGSDATFPRAYLKTKNKVKLVGGSDEIISYLKTK